MTDIYTIGYEGAGLEPFLAVLVEHGIDCLIDVRELPSSRRKGFSKNALFDALSGVGIDYVHLRGLGDPKPGRDAAKAGRINQFRNIYVQHMTTDAFNRDFECLTGLVRQYKACLMCYERNPLICYRKLICDAVALKLSAAIVHLGMPTLPSRHVKSVRSRKSPEPRQGAPVGEQQPW